MKSIPDRLKDIRDAEEKLINDILAIADSIEQLPENTKLNVISDNPSVFTIKSTDLGSSWLPEAHMYKTQYKYMADYIREHPIGFIRWWSDRKDSLTMPVYTKKADAWCWIDRSIRVVLNDEVMNNIDRLLGI